MQLGDVQTRSQPIRSRNHGAVKTAGAVGGGGVEDGERYVGADKIGQRRPGGQIGGNLNESIQSTGGRQVKSEALRGNGAYLRRKTLRLRWLRHAVKAPLGAASL